MLRLVAENMKKENMVFFKYSVRGPTWTRGSKDRERWKSSGMGLRRMNRRGRREWEVCAVGKATHPREGLHFEYRLTTIVFSLCGYWITEISSDH